MNKKILIGSIGVVMLSVLMLAPTSLGTILVNEQNNDGESILGWHTYRFCFVQGETLEMYPELWIGICPLVIFVEHFSSCTLFGWKGQKDVDEFIGFGFRGTIFPPPSPRDKYSIDGYFRLCLYKE